MGPPLRYLHPQGRRLYGYKIHAAVCTATGLPLAWRIETAKRQESLFVAPLLDALHARGFRPETVAMDKGYDNNRVYAECEERGVEPVIPLRGAKGNQTALPLAVGGRLFPRIPAAPTEFTKISTGAACAVEREFGRLKNGRASRRSACAALSASSFTPT